MEIEKPFHLLESHGCRLLNLMSLNKKELSRALITVLSETIRDKGSKADLGFSRSLMISGDSLPLSFIEAKIRGEERIKAGSVELREVA